MKIRKQSILILLCIFLIILTLGYCISGYYFRSKSDVINLKEGPSKYFLSYYLGLIQVMDDGVIYEYNYDNEVHKIVPSSPIIYIDENRTQKTEQRQLLIYKNGDIYVDDASQYKGEKIGNIDNAISGTISSKHIAIVTQTGDLYAYGSNQNGELGVAEVEGTGEFILVKDIPKVKKVICQDDYTFMLSEDGYVYGCGLWFKEKYPIFTLHKTKNNIIDIGCTFQTVVALDTKGYVYELGFPDFTEFGSQNNRDFERVKWLSNIKNISVGHHKTVVINKKGKVSFWGARNVRKAAGVHFIKRVYGINNADKIYGGSRFYYVIKNDTAYKIEFEP